MSAVSPTHTADEICSHHRSRPSKIIGVSEKAVNEEIPVYCGYANGVVVRKPYICRSISRCVRDLLGGPANRELGSWKE